MAIEQQSMILLGSSTEDLSPTNLAALFSFSQLGHYARKIILSASRPRFEPWGCWVRSANASPAPCCPHQWSLNISREQKVLCPTDRPANPVYRGSVMKFVRPRLLWSSIWIINCAVVSSTKWVYDNNILVCWTFSRPRMLVVDKN